MIIINNTLNLHQEYISIQSRLVVGLNFMKSNKQSLISPKHPQK